VTRKPNGIRNEESLSEKGNIMEACVIVTYRCNARCQMCNTWQHPSKMTEEIGPEIMKKLPEGLDKINITGGEPGLRHDLLEIVSVLRSKAKKIDISSNGYFTDRLVEVGRRYPKVAFRISVEGFPRLNDGLRGIKNGFDRALRTVIRLKEVGASNVGFGIVISDRTRADLLDLYKLCVMMGIEFGSSTLHNSFYFHKFDNRIEDIHATVEEMHRFIESLLQSSRPDLKLRSKDWGRAFINYGILEYIQGKSRPIPCGAATDLFFLDPYGRILACNGSENPWIMGNLKEERFGEIWRSEAAKEARVKVSGCQRNCWMVGSARPAMRSKPWTPLFWIIKNKIKLSLRKDIWY
jgi:MoaA/NifB/PqqE/SkfB family radical SAM enzyme